MLCHCGFNVERKREAAGYRTCRHCGDKAAAVQIAIKRTQTGPAYNKGNYVYLGGSNFKQNALDAGHKTSNSSDAVMSTGRVKAVKISKPKRKIIGVYYRDGDPYALYEGQDPAKMGASRWAIY